MLQRITGPLPEWTNPTNPMLSYQLGGDTKRSRRQRFIRVLGIVAAIGGLLVGGYLYATNLLTAPAGQNLTETVNRIVFFPLVILQVTIGIVALAMTVGTVGDEQRRITWDNLRATPSGAALVLRTRWISVFYRLRGLLIFATAVRLLLILGVLRDLTAFQGRYLDLLVGGVMPNFPVSVAGVPFAVPVAALLLSLFLTAALMLPFTMVALDAAVGIWLSTRFHQRVYSLVIQFLLVILRVAAVIGLIFVTLSFVEGNMTLPDAGWFPLEWVTIFSFSAFASVGLKLLHLAFAGEVWVLVPYSIFIGPLLLAMSMFQAFLADLILKHAIQTAERRG